MLTAASSCLVLSGTLQWWRFIQSAAGWWDTAFGCCLSVSVWQCPLDPCCWLQLCHAALPCWSSSVRALLVTCTCHPVYSRDALWYKERGGAVLSLNSSGTTLWVHSSLDWELISSQIQQPFTSDVTNTLSLKIFCLCYMWNTPPKAIMPYCTNKLTELFWKKTFYNPFKNWQDLQTYKITSKIVTIHSIK